MKTSKDLRRVEDKRQLKQLMYENLRRFPRWETNCIFEPGEVDRLLRRKSLYADTCRAGLYLLRRAQIQAVRMVGNGLAQQGKGAAHVGGQETVGVDAQVFYCQYDLFTVDFAHDALTLLSVFRR